MPAVPASRQEPSLEGSLLPPHDGPELVAALRAASPAAAAVLYDRFAPKVQRVLARVLGVDAELADLLQEVFLRALEAVDRIDDPQRLEGWLCAIAVHTAREQIRRRSRARWLAMLGWGMPAEPPARSQVVEDSEALRRTYAVLEKMPSDERIAFALRFVDGMELVAVAEACGVSLATIKRRLSKAQQRFVGLARNEPALEPWLEGGGRWTR
ncbi:MAG: sigma-70 family RNA polymerase sigma factor [Deltaproteobacteria bacterium]|nr:sigma-70 family RNA polymerase sigma factor [Deltaproteobacteria bacterium]